MSLVSLSPQAVLVVQHVPQPPGLQVRSGDDDDDDDDDDESINLFSRQELNFHLSIRFNVLNCNQIIKYLTFIFVYTFLFTKIPVFLFIVK